MEGFGALGVQNCEPRGILRRTSKYQLVQYRQAHADSDGLQTSKVWTFDMRFTHLQRSVKAPHTLLPVLKVTPPLCVKKLRVDSGQGCDAHLHHGIWEDPGILAPAAWGPADGGHHPLTLINPTHPTTRNSPLSDNGVVLRISSIMGEWNDI